MPEITVNEENIVCSLMVGYKDIGGGTVELLPPSDFDTHQRDKTKKSGPNKPRIVAPHPVITEKTANDSDKRRHNSYHHHDRHVNNPLIQLTQDDLN